MCTQWMQSKNRIERYNINVNYVVSPVLPYYLDLIDTYWAVTTGQPTRRGLLWRRWATFPWAAPNSRSKIKDGTLAISFKINAQRRQGKRNSVRIRAALPSSFLENIGRFLNSDALWTSQWELQGKLWIVMLPGYLKVSHSSSFQFAHIFFFSIFNDVEVDAM